MSRLQWCTITSGFIVYIFHYFLSGSMRNPEIITVYNQSSHSVCYQSPKTHQWKPAHISSAQHTSSEVRTYHQNPEHRINAQCTSLDMTMASIEAWAGKSFGLNAIRASSIHSPAWPSLSAFYQYLMTDIVSISLPHCFHSGTLLKNILMLEVDLFIKSPSKISWYE